MITLAVDSSSKVATVALMKDEKLLSEILSFIINFENPRMFEKRVKYTS